MDLTAVTWVAMVAAAVGGLGCTVTAKPRQPGAIVSAAIMLVAMFDMAVGHILLVPVAWTAVLLALGVIVVALPRALDDLCGWHHGLALVGAAMIMASSPHALPVSNTSELVHGVHPGSTLHLSGGGWTLGLLITIGYVVVAGPPLLRRATSPIEALPSPGRGTQVAQVAQVASTAGCLAVMSLLPLPA